MLELPSNIVITEKRENTKSQTYIKLPRAFTDKVINFTDEPVFNVMFQLSKNTFVDDGKITLTNKF